MTPSNGTPPTIHECALQVQGDWVVFTRPLCPRFERRINLQTSEMEFGPEPDDNILHHGAHVPPGLEVGGVGLN